MKKIYFLKDKSGFKYTAYMFTNYKAAENRIKELREVQPEKEYEIDFGYAYSY